ncbi:Lrp/AsnC family transcriptional regulator [Nocardia sp. CA-135398]|uniref:Lrp/AsnC family transcriptional regulator n=1 Tax=Nocardia sp. CA-135398 TaxID=3239977 RepID=UPI003D953FC8
MADSTSESPDIGSINSGMRDFDSRTLFGERDLDLINALQINPRASWALIGASLGQDATTVARRWQQLTASGLAWMTAYAPDLATIGYLRVRCRPDTGTALGERFCASPCVLSVECLSGRFDFLLTVAAASTDALHDFATRWLPGLPGVEEVRSTVVVYSYFDGSHWRPMSLDPQQLAVLRDSDDHAPTSARRRSGDVELVRALGADARRSAVELAEIVGVSDATVRRRIAEMTRSGWLLFRCDFARSVAGWPFAVNLRVRVPATRLDDLGTALADWPEVRLCTVTVDDEANAMIIAWLRAPRDIVALEYRLLQRFSDITIIDRVFELASLKRVGRLLDPRTGVAIGHVPLDIYI